jgi:hypothetical protein
MTDLRQAAEMALEAMKQALDALNTTDTHPISSAEQYFKETQAMEALEDAIEDAEEVTVDWEAVAADQALTIAMMRSEKPVAWTNKENLLDLKSGVCSHMYAKKEDDDDLPLYAAPPQDEMVSKLFEENQRLLAELSQVEKQEQPSKHNKIEIVIRKPMTWVDDDGNIWRNVSHNTPLYPEPPLRERIVFPTSLRKMWSGTDVQHWLDANVNGEAYD